MQRPGAMDRINKKLIRKAMRNMPDLPFGIRLAARRRVVLPYVLGAIGVAVFGAVAAIMIFSPRTRYRAIGAAKGAYGKLGGRARQRIEEMRSGEGILEERSNYAPSGL